MYEVEQQIQRKDEENKKVILDYQVKLEEAEIKTQRLILSAEIRRRTEAYREEQGSKKVQLERADSYGKIVRKSREDVDVETDHLHRSGGSNENENLRRLHDILKNHESKFTPDDNAGGKQHNSQHNNRIHHQSRKDSFNDHPSRKDSYNDSTPRYRRQSIIRSEAPFIPKKPVFSGEQFALGFLDRLKWFTESKLRNQIALKEEIKSMQNESNEKRLYQLGLLNSERKPAISSGFNAEFMPMPGNVQGPKKDLLPWGGAFRSSPKKRTQDFSNNVLNLFSESSRMENLKKEDGKKI